MQDSDAKMKIHHFPIEKSSVSRKALPEPLLKDLTKGDVKNYEFENLEISIDYFFWHFRAVRERMQKHALKAQCYGWGGSFPETLGHQFSKGTDLKNPQFSNCSQKRSI